MFENCKNQLKYDLPYFVPYLLPYFFMIARGLTKWPQVNRMGEPFGLPAQVGIF